jgi:zinc protease
LMLSTIGDIAPTQMGIIIDNIFADLPEGTAWQGSTLQLKHRGETWFNNFDGGQQNVIIFTAPSVLPTDADYPAALIINNILGGGGFSAALMDELRQTLGATYGASTGISGMRAAPLLMGQSAVIADKTDEAKAVINTVWANAATYLTDERVADSVTYLSGSLTNDLTSSAAIADYYLGLQIAGLPVDTVARLPAQLKAVTKADLARVLSRLYKPTDLSYVIVGPKKPAATTRSITNLWTVQ